MSYIWLLAYIALLHINVDAISLDTNINNVETHDTTIKRLQENLDDCQASISDKAISALITEKALEITAKTQIAKENDQIDISNHIVIFIHSYKHPNDEMIDYRLASMDLSLGTRDIVFTPFNWQSIVRILNLSTIDTNDVSQIAPYFIQFIHEIRHKYKTIDIIAHSTGNDLLIAALSNVLNTNRTELFLQSTIISIEAEVTEELFMKIVNDFGGVINKWIHLNYVGSTKIESDFVDFIEFEGWSMTNYDINLKQIIIEYIIGKKKDIISLNGIYSVHGYYDGYDEKYLSYHERSGFCRQRYGDPMDSKFEFIVHDKINGLYYIRNRFDDKRKNLWLGFGEREAFNGNMVGLFDINHRSLWKLIPTNDGKMSFKISCFKDNVFNGWLSYQYNGKWNRLYQNEHDASIYVLELIKGTKKRLLQKSEL